MYSDPIFGQRRGRRWPLSVAPMMDRTDRHYRYFMRQITRHTLLYTEMLTTGAILRGNREALLGFSACERPLALQLGGDDPAQLAACARLAEAWGYDEVNLNVGCPSERVQEARFGVCLMAQPEQVARCVAAMRQATALPVTVKHRLGIEGQDYADLVRFVRTVARAGCDRFIVHARIAILRGLSPKANRTIPPLRYDEVYRLKREFPELVIELNGGVTTLEQARQHLQRVDGVMIGRAAYDNPFLFARADALFYDDATPPPTRRQVLVAMLPYLEAWLARGLPLHRITRHMLGLFAGQPGSRLWKQLLSQPAPSASVALQRLHEALARLPAAVLDAPPETVPLTPTPA
ncbi:MAG: tRNA-dihydrouridine(20/20a) synthase [Candidatus Tectimicrobiota bacterium]|nr:MAG: tRNA-dihydrouridine(20/20a) synthase [Candidatus Tectomicrobia bacterium]